MAKDILIKGPQIGPNANVVIREKDGVKTIGVAGIAKEGMPLNGRSLVTVEHIEGPEFRVIDEYDPNATAEESASGPAMVNSQAYRDNWDKIFN